MGKRASNLGKTVVVDWEDAFVTVSEYFDYEKASKREPVKGRCAGFLIRDDKEFVGVSLESFADGDYRTTQFIPRPMVRKVTVVK